jgi:hypothetical protein
MKGQRPATGYQIVREGGVSWNDLRCSRLSRLVSGSGGDKRMYNSEQYRAKAAQAGDSARQSKSPNDRREFLRAQQSYTALAENEEWVERNRDKVISKAS